MYKKIKILFLILIGILFFTGCSNETVTSNDLNILESNLEKSEELNYLTGIQTAPEYNEENSKDNSSLGFEDSFTSDKESEIQKEESNDTNKNEQNSSLNNNSNNKEETNSKNNNDNSDNTNNKEENKPIEKENLLEFKKVTSFVKPTDFSFSELEKRDEFKSLQNFINKNLKNATIRVKDNCISYNSSANGPSIEIYKTDEYYAIYLYCILNNEKTTSKESTNQIEINNIVLKNLLKTISSTPEEIYEAIYQDYEIDSTISEQKYTKTGDCKIKSEIMQKYVIYYLKSN